MVLNNHEAFLLLNNDKGYFWKGKNCNPKEIELGQKFLHFISDNNEEFVEGEES